jgi:1,4-dihydroxy-2-naphthoate octaprenyltransferase
VTSVLIGKHVDKLPADSAKGIRTLPVILGAEASLALDRWLMVGFYVATAALVATGIVGPWCLLVLAGVPRLMETLATFRQPRPDSPPDGYPIWPLWYVAWAFRHTRRAGALLVAGLILDAFVPLQL